MSKYNNVNPDHYKVAGRERPGNSVAKSPKELADDEKQTAARWQARERERQGRRTPGGTPATARGR